MSQSRPLTVSMAGGLGVVLIHALLALPFVLNLSAPSPRRPNVTGAGATAIVSSAELEMTAVFIDEPASAQQMQPSALASRGQTPADLQLVVLSADPYPAAPRMKTQDSDVAQDVGAAEAAEHALLYGRYIGQLQARIERAWMRPRTEIGAPQFSCRVRIQQTRRGELVDIRLDHCNGTERWQQSLLSAIRTASPLPSPPDESVYADVLWMSFASGGFTDGSSDQGFEPQRPNAPPAL